MDNEPPNAITWTSPPWAGYNRSVDLSWTRPYDNAYVITELPVPAQAKQRHQVGRLDGYGGASQLRSDSWPTADYLDRQQLPDATSHALTGLGESGRPTTIEVRAVNSGGTGPENDVVSGGW